MITSPRWLLAQESHLSPVVKELATSVLVWYDAWTLTIHACLQLGSLFDTCYHLNVLVISVTYQK